MYSTSWFASELCSTMKAFKAGQTLEPRLSLRFTLVAEILWCRSSQLQQACTGSSISFSRSLIIRACLMNNCASKLRGTERVLHHQQVADNWSSASCRETLSWWFFNRAQMPNALCRRVRTGSVPKSHRSLKFF